MHIPEVLYLWRMSARSTAADRIRSPTRVLMVRRLCRNTASAQVLTRRWFKAKRPVEYELERRPTPGLTASIIIPTWLARDYSWRRPMHGGEAVRSVAKHEYSVNYEFVVVYDDRPGIDLGYQTDLAEIAGDRLKLVRFTEPFNFSRKVEMSGCQCIR